ncbi:MAG: glycogen debranching N-terminal domain-containing protein [Ilumatobacteraceae bacterium]
MSGDTVTILDGSTFLVCGRRGDIEVGADQPHGLFFRDTRFLSLWRLTLDGAPLKVLSTDDVDYFSSQFFLVPVTGSIYRNPSLSVIRQRSVGDGLHEDLVVLNHSSDEIVVELRVDADADFADILEVKDALAESGERSTDVRKDPLLMRYQRGEFVRETLIVPSDDQDRWCPCGGDRLEFGRREKRPMASQVGFNDRGHQMWLSCSRFERYARRGTGNFDRDARRVLGPTVHRCQPVQHENQSADCRPQKRWRDDHRHRADRCQPWGNASREASSGCEPQAPGQNEQVAEAAPVMAFGVAASESRVAGGAPDRLGDLIVAEHLEHDARHDDRESNEHDQPQLWPPDHRHQYEQHDKLGGLHRSAGHVFAPVTVWFGGQHVGQGRCDRRQRHSDAQPLRISSASHNAAAREDRPAHNATNASAGRTRATRRVRSIRPRAKASL